MPLCRRRRLEPIPHRRLRLPDPVQAEPTASLFSMLASAAGKDLSRMALPVYTNEPLSALQKWCEELQYCSLLETAAKWVAEGAAGLPGAGALPVPLVLPC